MPFVWPRFLSLLFAVMTVPLAVTLLCVAQSIEARVFAAGGILIGLGPLLFYMGKERESPRMEWVGLLACLMWASSIVWLAFRAPSGTVADEKQALIQHRFVKEGIYYQKHSPGNLLPELDQLLLGFKIMPMVDRLLTTTQAKNLSELTSGIYQELEADADFHALGALMPMAYDDLLRGQADHGHYLLYVPKNLPRNRPAPGLVFLHGSGGNFKAYSWLLSKIADKLDMVLICPSYGIGKWDPKRTSSLIRLALEDAKKIVPLDPNQIHLAGLSNGGLGVSYLARDMGDRFKSLIFISPVMDKPSLDSSEFAARFQQRPVFVMTGDQDDRVPISSVLYMVSKMEQREAKVTLKRVPDADHFLLFSHRDEVLKQLTAWIQEASKPAPPPVTPAERSETNPQ